MEKGPSDELHEQHEDYANECSGLYSLKAYDEMSGEEIDIDLVRWARREESTYFRGMNVYTKVPLSECYEKTGLALIGVKWVDTNKGDDITPNVRSRLVAREIRQACDEAICAPCPPLESLRSVLSITATDRPGAPNK